MPKTASYPRPRRGDVRNATLARKFWRDRCRLALARDGYALVNANVDGESLTDAELASFFILLVVAGNETTRNAISHGLWAFTESGC